MNDNKLNTEQVILKAAETEFLEKGFAGAKMMSIAKRANVAHSMLHYYFRNKESLFQKVYFQKVQEVLPLLQGVIDRELSIFETIEEIIKTQFNFLKENPKLPFFILTEIINNKKNRDLLLDSIREKVTPVVEKFNAFFEDEIRKGNVYPTLFQDLIMNILSINISSFVVLPIYQEITQKSYSSMEDIYEERLKNNIKFILNALRV